ncbi:MAG: efflux RND transporter permease subunit [Verrucomicrobiota bacterium]|jgi:HAE1 family hydrophobic/amphiphilic exporter-1
MAQPSSHKLAHFTTDRPVAVLMVFIAAVVFGYFSFKRLPVTLMPELNYPTLTVRTEYEGAAPEEVENEVSRPVEETLGVVNGLNRISSISRAGISDVVLEFVWGTDMSQAAQDTLEKMDQVFLPQEVEKPLILHFDPSLDPIMELSLSGEGIRFEGEIGLRRLRRLAEIQIRRALEPITGVAAVRIRGGLEEEIHVMLDQQALRRTGVSIQQVVARLKQENINVAGGMVQEGRSEFMVRTLNEFTNQKEIEDTIIRRDASGEVRIRDIGSVSRSHRDREIVTRTDGRESVQIDIYKEADANIVSVAQAVKSAVGTVGPSQMPPLMQMMARFNPMIRNMFRDRLAAKLLKTEGARLEVVADRSVFIENSINEVRQTAVVGGVLAVIVLFLFLRDFKSTVIVAVSIPMSILITFAPLNLSEVSLNIMSLGGLALGVGMLVDSSIVVLESIYRCIQEGDDLKTAAIRGAREVRGAVTASTLTSIAVFLPMVFVEGIAGQVFGDLGMAVVISLIASLLVAVYFIPMLASRARPNIQRREISRLTWKRWMAVESLLADLADVRQGWKKLLIPYVCLKCVIACVLEFVGKVIGMTLSGMTRLVVKRLVPLAAKMGGLLVKWPVEITQNLLTWLTDRYPRWLERALDRPSGVFGLVGMALALTVWIGFSLDTELLPEVHQGEVTVELNLPVGTPLEVTVETLSNIESFLLADQADIKTVLTTFGYDITNMKRSDEGEHSARFKLLLEGQGGPAQVEERVLAQVRNKLDRVPDLTYRVTRPVLFSTRKPISVEIHSDDLDQLKDMADEVEEVLMGLVELADVETTLRPGAPEIQITYDRAALSRYELNIGQVADLVRNLVQGNEATRFNMKDRRIPIIARLDEADRQKIDDIGNLTVNPGSDKPIPLSAVADYSIGEGPSEIRRIDGKRVALVQANLGDASLGRAVGTIKATLDQTIDWPIDMNYFIAGQSEEWQHSQNSLFLAMGLSVFLVYVIMASQFESLLQPFIIMFSVPLAFVGSAVGLAVTGTSLSVVVFLGLIMLVGIVVNNAIVLVDYTNLLRTRGLGPKDAILTACSVRLRPILMTTATTVLGLLPMAIGLGDGAEIRTPMAIAVISGLISSTVLTLIVVPSIYFLLDRWMHPDVESDTIDPEQPSIQP